MNKTLKNVISSILLFAMFAFGSFFAYLLISNQAEDSKQLNYQREIQFASGRISDLCEEFDQGTLDTAISHVYGAYLYCDDEKKSEELYDLWNALIFYGDGLRYCSDEDLEVLKNGQNGEISGLAHTIRMNSDVYKFAQIEEKIEWEEDEYFAVALLGYDGDFGKNSDLNALCDDYIYEIFDVKDAQNEIFDACGDENYLIIPRYPKCEINIYEQVFEGSAIEQGDLLYSFSNKPYFVLKCNISDIWSNVGIESDVNGEFVSFYPSISLKDGSLNPSFNIRDITNY